MDSKNLGIDQMDTIKEMKCNFVIIFINSKIFIYRKQNEIQ